MNNYNPLMPKNKIYILKRDGEVYKIVGNKEDEIPMKMIGIAFDKKEKINSKDLENTIEKVCEAGGMKE